MFKLNYNSDGTSVEKYDITTYVLQYIYIYYNNIIKYTNILFIDQRGWD